ncbi:MAG: CapA family protein [Blautia sp.]|nr:CapA family protein [Blautia sp.]MCM1200165.1 CapA family protein [Bacteroides fragilis]
MGRKRRRKKRPNFIMPFCITLIIVISAGLFAMFAYQYVEKAEEPVQRNIQSTKETIVEEPPLEKEDEEEEEEAENGKEEPAVNKSRYADILQDEAYMAEHNIYAKEAASEDSVTITFAGDILFDPNYSVMARVLQSGGDIGSGIAPDLIGEMQSADIMMLNNEFAYSDRGEPTPEKQFTFRARPDSAAYLTELGVDIVSLANNHAYDYGEQALLDTMQILREEGIPYVGAGGNIEEASAPVCFIVNDIRIAFVSATQIERLDNPDTKGATGTSPGVFRCLNGERLMQTVAAAKEENDFVIVYIHWGTENQEETDWAQEKQAPELAAAGADLIIGDHPHILQRIEIIDGVPVIYSLGNFWFNSRPIDTGMVKVTVTEEGLQSFQFIPCIQNNCRTSLLEGEEKARVLGEMRRMSQGVQIDEDGYVTLP